MLVTLRVKLLFITFNWYLEYFLKSLLARLNISSAKLRPFLNNNI